MVGTGQFVVAILSLIKFSPELRARSIFKSSAAKCLALLSLSMLCHGAVTTQFKVELFEETPSPWMQRGPGEVRTPDMTWGTEVLGLIAVPDKISLAGQSMRRVKPFLARVTGLKKLQAGEYEFRLRSRMHARFYIDDELILESEPPKPKQLTTEEIIAKEAEDKKAREEAAQKEAEQRAREELLQRKLEDPNLTTGQENRKAIKAELENELKIGTEKSNSKPPAPMEEQVKKVSLRTEAYRLRLELTGESLDQEVSVVYRKGKGELATLGDRNQISYSEKGWANWLDAEKQTTEEVMQALREPRWKQWEKSWKERHAALARQVNASRKLIKEKLPPRLSQSDVIDLYVGNKVKAHKVQPAALTNDYEFVRRAYLDTWGLIPMAQEVDEFVKDSRPNKREFLINKLLADDRWADPWVGYWEDVLAENPKLFGDQPNATGAFKEWIHRSFVEDRGYDRFATELVLMEGTPKQPGTLGFLESFGNDVPLAEKAHIISQTFMGANLKCARCHDSPLNSYTQRELFGIAAMLNGGPLAIPETSSAGAVPGRRVPLVPVTSKPGELIPPSFVFAPDQDPAEIRGTDRAFRETLAEWLTTQRRFAQVGVNRIWKRFMGTGLVEPVDEWEADSRISHPEMLDYLVEEFIGSGFSVKRVEELILKSQAYQRKRRHKVAELTDALGLPLFAAQPTRRMTAEELVDSLHRAVRREFRSERLAYRGIDYGYPRRTWQIVTLSNEEDHVILARPLLQEIVTLATAFGWREQRPDPLSVRSTDPNPLQALSLANGELVTRLVKLTDKSHYTELSSRSISLEEFIDHLFLNTFSRPAKENEKNWISKKLEDVWNDRRVPIALQSKEVEKESHMDQVRVPDTLAAEQYVQKIKQGEPTSAGLTEAYKEKMQEVLWLIFNSPEFIFLP